MKKLMVPVAIAAIAGGAGFWGGTQYAGKGMPAQGGDRAAFAGRRGGGMGGGMRDRGGFAAGTVVAKDEKGLTVEMQGGGSKVVFISASTKIMTSVAGTAADIAVGGRVMVSGQANADGSVTAESIDIR